jgi:hypothetical protein
VARLYMHVSAIHLTYHGWVAVVEALAIHMLHAALAAARQEVGIPGWFKEQGIKPYLVLATSAANSMSAPAASPLASAVARYIAIMHRSLTSSKRGEN